MDEPAHAAVSEALREESFRAASKALREEFIHAADRHPDLFFEKIAIGSPDPSRWEPRNVCQAFIEANHCKDSPEEWYVLTDGKACGRFYGDLAGIAKFRQLAESLFLSLCKVCHKAPTAGNQRSGFLKCLEMVVETAFMYPMPLLRGRLCYWGTDEPIFDGGHFVDPEMEMVPARDDHPPYPLHPSRICLIHNVFTSVAAFIDAVMEPNNVLLLSAGTSLSLDSDMTPERPPITLPQDSEGEVKESKGEIKEQRGKVVEPRDEVKDDVGEGTTTDRKREAEYPYIMKRELQAWSMCYEMETASFGRPKRFEPIARLLFERGREIDAKELRGRGVDVEREEAAKQAQSEQPDKPQPGTKDVKITPRGIRLATEENDRLKGEIQLIMGQPDLVEKMDKIENLTVKLRRGCRFLDKATRDKEYVERKSSPGEQGGTVKDERVSDITNRIDELLSEIQEARKRNENRKVDTLQEELLERLHRWLEPIREKMKHRRPRTLGGGGQEERDRRAVEMRIDRALKDIADAMLRCGEYLKETIVPVDDKPNKWVYKGNIVWKVEGI